MLHSEEFKACCIVVFAGEGESIQFFTNRNSNISKRWDYIYKDAGIDMKEFRLILNYIKLIVRLSSETTT